VTTIFHPPLFVANYHSPRLVLWIDFLPKPTMLSWHPHRKWKVACLVAVAVAVAPVGFSADNHWYTAFGGSHAVGLGLGSPNEFQIFGSLLLCI
jgi:hypothetical protein